MDLIAKENNLNVNLMNEIYKYKDMKYILLTKNQ